MSLLVVKSSSKFFLHTATHLVMGNGAVSREVDAKDLDTELSRRWETECPTEVQKPEQEGGN